MNIFDKYCKASPDYHGQVFWYIVPLAGRLPLWQLFMYFRPYWPVLPFPSSTINGQSSGCGDITINNIYSPYRYCKIETLFAEVVNSLVLTARHRRRCVKWFHDIFCSHERSVLSLSDISYCILTFPTHFRELKSELMWLLEISYCIKMGDLAFRDFTFLKVSMHNIYSNFVSQTFMSFRRQPITYFQWVCLYSISEVRGLLIDRQGHFNANADCQWFIILILMLLLRLMSLHPRCPLSSTCYSYISKNILLENVAKKKKTQTIMELSQDIGQRESMLKFSNTMSVSSGI